MDINNNVKPVGLYAIRDKVTGRTNVPVAYENSAVAVRSFRTAIQTDSILYHNRSDYELVLVGHFDSDNGVVSPDFDLIAFGADQTRVASDEVNFE